MVCDMRAGRTLRNIIITDIVMILTMLVFLTAHAVCGQGWMLSAYVTSLTGSYHFTMRLIVGQIMILYYRKHPPRPGSFTTRSFAFEPELYRRLNVKSWKNRLITARPDQFDMKNLTPAEMLRSMVQAETGHLMIMLLSFLPLLLIIPYGTAPVFIITSVLACMMEVPFVIIQRYNIPRIIRYMELTGQRCR
ncbi:MAG: hypothetical protein ACLS8Q_11000 [Anaerovoracaceae bacterium]